MHPLEPAHHNAQTRPRAVRILSAALLALAVAFPGSPFPRLTESVAAAEVAFNPEADTYVDASKPTTNYGSRHEMRVDGTPAVNAYLRFDVSGVSDFSAAVLRLYVRSSASQGVEVHTVANTTWDESTIDWNTAPPIGALVASTGPVAGGTWVDVDVSGLVTQEGPVSFAITTPSATAVAIRSRESGDPPQLLVGSASGNQDPIASFTYLCTDLDCTFDASGSTDPDGSIVDYSWVFGTDGVGSGVNPNHTFSAAGDHDVTLTVTDDGGASDALTQTVTVTESPPPPGGTVYTVTRIGSTYEATSGAQTYSGSLKSVVESAVADLNGGSGGTISFTAGDFDLGSEWFRFDDELVDITFVGQGIDTTVIRNFTTVASDTEPFNFRGTNRVAIRDLTVHAGGPARTTSDAIDFDRGNNSVVERVKVTASRGKGIIFDGKNVDSDGTPWHSEGNVVRDCIITGTNNDGIQFLASSNNLVENCTIFDVAEDGIDVRKSQSSAQQPNKKSNGNVLLGNTITGAGHNGIRVTSSDANRVTANTITNSLMDGILIESSDGITCDDNIVDGNTATDTQAVKTQAYGLHIASPFCNRTVVGDNSFIGNRDGDIRDDGTGTIYQTTDTTPPSVPQNLVATASGAAQVDLTWSASTDDVLVAGYEIFRDGFLLAAVGPITNYADPTVSPSTTYAYEVRALDAAGNRSGLSQPAIVTTPDANTFTYTPVADTYIRADQAGVNFGTATELHVDGNPVKDTLLKFNVGGVGGNVISARIRLFCINSSRNGGEFRHVPDNSWSETGVTWNNAPSATSAIVADLNSVRSGSWYEVDVTSLVTGNGVFSLRISSGSSDGADYVSREGSASSWPQLVIITEGDGTPPPDTEPPTAPTAVDAQALNANLVEVTWTAATDNVGVTGYDILRNGSLLDSVGPVTSYQDTAVAPSTTYTYEVRAEDAAGNQSPLSNPATATTPPASSAACQDSSSGSGGYTVTVCIIEPADGSSLVGDEQVSATVAFNGPSPGIQKVIFSLGSEYLLTDYQAPFTFTLETTRWADGQRTISAETYLRDGFIADPVGVQVSFDNGISDPPPNTNQFTPTQGTTPAPGQPFVFAAAGDGADGSVNAQNVTDLIASWNPNMFSYVGDVYDRGTPTEFTNWYGLDTGYGSFRSITNPVIGNHENLTPGSAGYFDYWDNVPNYYSVDAGGWHLVFIDSTGTFGETTPSSAQYQWIAADLAANSNPCTMAILHHPVWTIGPSDNTGDPNRVRPIWELLANSGVDLVLNGHDHNYQRWLPMDANGNLSSSGTTEIVVGTGGHGIQGFVRSDSRVAAGFDSSPGAFGALRLELNAAGAAFLFADVSGQTLDSGSLQCNGSSDTEPPTAPSGLNAVATSATSVDLSWTASTDNVGVTGYDIYRDGALLAQVGPQTTFTDQPVSPETTYAYEVQARDAAGNVSASSNTATVTTPPGPTGGATFTPVADSYVESAQPTVNNGTKTQVRCDGSPIVTSYLKFDAQVGGTVNGAILRIYVNSNHSVGFDVHVASSSSWTETGITYANAPSYGGVIGSSGPFSGGSWAEIDVSSVVTGSGTYTLVLTTTSSTAMSLASRESGANAPQLVIDAS